MELHESLKYFAMLMFMFLKEHKLKADVFSNVFIGVATGVIANIMFVITTTKDYHFVNLTLSFVLAIILLLVGSIEKKEM